MDEHILGQNVSVQPALKDRNIPDNFYLGEAVNNGDCFFDAVAQSLTQLKPDQVFNVKSLRLICRNFMQHNLSNEQSWFKQQYESDQNSYYESIPRIEFTAKEIKDASDPVIKDLKITTPIWGRPEIEGRIICQAYDIQLHISEHQIIDGNTVVVDQMIDSTGSKTTDIDYSSSNIIHIVNNGRNHLVPLLDNSKTVPQSHDLDFGQNN